MTDRALTALRYAGAPDAQDAALLALARDGLKQTDPLSAHAAHRIYPLDWMADGVRIGSVEIHSAHAVRILAGCDRCAVLAVTLGQPADAMLAAAMRRGVSDALVLGACMDMRLEAELMRELCEIERELPGLYCTPRTAPGYGDFPLERQGEVLRLLDADKRIGLFSNAQGALLPQKSLTALVGLKYERNARSGDKCAHCGRKGCLYRREKTVCL